MKSTIFAGAFALFASAVSALTPTVGQPQGNPIAKPGLNDIVEAGKPYTITWNPTSKGTVSLVLLRGPSTNVVPLSTIVEGIANTGTYTWTPSTDLEDDVTHYGLQLIQDATGFFQYSTQFGVSNKKAAVPTVEKPTETAPAAAPDSYTTPAAVVPDSGNVVYSTHYATVTSCDCTETPAVPAATGTGVPPTYQNGTTPEYSAPAAPAVPVASVSVSTPAPPTYTGAASQMKVGGAMVAVLAGMVAALL